MYAFISSLLSDKKGGTVFTCFGVWHLLYMAVIFGFILAALLILKDKSASTKQKALTFSANLAFGMYIADFFLMPFAYGEIDLEKLPFHACTATCIASFISRHNSFFDKYRVQLAMLGLVSNIIYVIYPAGVGWHMVHPLSYRTLQTLLFHGVMSAYGILTLAFDENRPSIKNCVKDTVAIVIMTVWAILGNTLYNGTHGDYSHNFNWFFVIEDPFGLLPKDISVFLMPFVMIAVMLTAEMIVYAVYYALRRFARYGASQKKYNKAKQIAAD